MGLGSLNYLAIMAAAVVSFVFGGVWYNVFSKQWMEAVGMPPERVKERGGVGLYVLAFVAQLVMAWMLAGILLHLARGGLPPTLWNGDRLGRLHLARLRHHHHGRQLRVPWRQAHADPDRRRPLARHAADPGRDTGLVGAALTLALSARPATAPPQMDT